MYTTGYPPPGGPPYLGGGAPTAGGYDAVPNGGPQDDDHNTAAQCAEYERLLGDVETAIDRGDRDGAKRCMGEVQRHREWSGESLLETMENTGRFSYNAAGRKKLEGKYNKLCGTNFGSASGAHDEHASLHKWGCRIAGCFFCLVLVAGIVVLVLYFREVGPFAPRPPGLQAAAGALCSTLSCTAGYVPKPIIAGAVEPHCAATTCSFGPDLGVCCDVAPTAQPTAQPTPQPTAAVAGALCSTLSCTAGYVPKPIPAGAAEPHCASTTCSFGPDLGVCCDLVATR